MISLELVRGDERGRASLAALCRARAKRGCRTTACCYSNTPRDAHASCRRSVGRKRLWAPTFQGTAKVKRRAGWTIEISAIATQQLGAIVSGTRCS